MTTLLFTDPESAPQAKAQNFTRQTPFKAFRMRSRAFTRYAESTRLNFEGYQRLTSSFWISSSTTKKNYRGSGQDHKTSKHACHYWRLPAHTGIAKKYELLMNAIMKALAVTETPFTGTDGLENPGAGLHPPPLCAGPRATGFWGQCRGGTHFLASLGFHPRRQIFEGSFLGHRTEG